MHQMHRHPKGLCQQLPVDTVPKRTGASTPSAGARHDLVSGAAVAWFRVPFAAQETTKVPLAFRGCIIIDQRINAAIDTANADTEEVGKIDTPRVVFIRKMYIVS